MKLVEILALELEEWPEGVTWICQDSSNWNPNRLVGFKRNKPSFEGYNACSRNGNCWTQIASHTADDQLGAIITRADWEAERARIKGDSQVKPKANKDGWIRHRGGKCPVEAVTLVDVKCRDGSVHEGLLAHWWLWHHKKDDDDIMAWKLHKAERQIEPAVVANVDAFNAQAEMPAAKYFDGPLQWRDRILDLDAEQKAADEAHKAATEARSSERAELVQKLAGEGLALLGQQETPGPAEDMSDWRNWKAGDLLEMIDADLWSGMTNGKLYALLEPCDDQVFRVVDDMGDVHKFDELQMQCSASPALDFKWHSRPSK